jgi:hypothetical protein
MLPAWVFLALAAFAAAGLLSPLTSRAAWLHLMLAAGAMPLILAAMGHFIPVLTRTREAGGWVDTLPVAAFAAGTLAVVAFSLPALAWVWPLGALLALVPAAGMAAFSRQRRGAMLGQPHACLGWYEAALACLALALLAILAGRLWPEQFAALRRLHLHLNMLGFIGLTAVGTLAVLLPTAAGRPDPGAAPRLKRDLPLALAGTLLIAAGAAWFAPLVWLGVALWGVPLVRLGRAWATLYRSEILALHGASPLLAAASVGFALSLLAGAVAPLTGKKSADATFVAGFLLPLVTGASAQLLPVWLKPGVQGPWHAGLRGRLGRHGGVRAAFFLLAGSLTAGGVRCGLLLGVTILLWSLLQYTLAVIRAQSNR